VTREFYLKTPLGCKVVLASCRYSLSLSPSVANRDVKGRERLLLFFLLLVLKTWTASELDETRRRDT
jgi:hypothetical protein